MHGQGQAIDRSKETRRMQITDDQIREKYLERAIRELNILTHEIHGCTACPRGSLMPVLGSGHPQADIFMLKYAPMPSEIEEGVAFFGRSGNALMKSLRRLQIDPLAVYGTLAVKCPVTDTEHTDPACVGRVLDEIAIVSPKMLVVMGEDALDVFNGLRLPAARVLEPRLGEVQPVTPSMVGLYVPNIDTALDDDRSKRAFWSAFRVLGRWYAELPPY
jgi:uracil-DNA glycosylase family 4